MIVCYGTLRPQQKFDVVVSFLLDVPLSIGSCSKEAAVVRILYGVVYFYFSP
jgi:hypothetical protein